jgi:hypothetical protein
VAGERVEKNLVKLVDKVKIIETIGEENKLSEKESNFQSDFDYYLQLVPTLKDEFNSIIDNKDFI